MKFVVFFNLVISTHRVALSGDAAQISLSERVSLDYWHVSVSCGTVAGLDPTFGCNIIAAVEQGKAKGDHHMSTQLKGNAVVGQSGGPTAVINQSLVGVIQGVKGCGHIEQLLGARHGVRGSSMKNSSI